MCLSGRDGGLQKGSGLLGQSQNLQGHREPLQEAVPKASFPSCLVSLGEHYKGLSRGKELKYGEGSSRKLSL